MFSSKLEKKLYAKLIFQKIRCIYAMGKIASSLSFGKNIYFICFKKFSIEVISSNGIPFG